MNDVMWFLSRATGIVAAALMALAVVSGFLFSARETGRHRRPAWWLDLHNMLGGLSLVFVCAHVLFAVLDPDLAISIASVFVPGIADVDRWPIAWGAIAMYLVATTVLTSWPERRFRRRTWRTIHLGSVVGLALAVVHTLRLGTDAESAWLRLTLLVIVAVATYSLGVRIFGLALPPDRDSQAELR